MFSVLGTQLFGGVINTDPKSHYSKVLAATDFGQAGYYANNFNDMPSGRKEPSYFQFGTFNFAKRSPPYNFNTKYTSPLRVFDNFNSKAKTIATFNSCKIKNAESKVTRVLRDRRSCKAHQDPGPVP